MTDNPWASNPDDVKAWAKENSLGFLDIRDRGLEAAMDKLQLGSTEGDLPVENRRAVEVREVRNPSTGPVAATTHRAVDGNPVAPPFRDGDPSKIKTTVIILVTASLMVGGFIWFCIWIMEKFAEAGQ